MSKREVIFNPSFSVEGQADGSLTLRIHIDPLAGESIEYIFGPLEAVRFGADVARTAFQAAAEAIDNLAVGPCDECKNYRLVTVEAHGREQKEYCPSCNGRRGPDAVREAIHASAPYIRHEENDSE